MHQRVIETLSTTELIPLMKKVAQRKPSQIPELSAPAVASRHLGSHKAIVHKILIHLG